MSDWITWAMRRDGPPNKVFPQPNAMLGLVCHSVEGWLSGAFGELDRPDRQASWHFTNALDGTLYQHYPLSASCWASGNFEANTRFVAIESEGVATMTGPLNDAQVATMQRLAGEFAAMGVPLVRGQTLFEHNEVAMMWSPNGGPTACPSHRYDPFFMDVEGNELPDPRVDKLLAAWGGEGAVDGWNANGNSLLLGYTQMQQQLNDLIGQVSAMAQQVNAISQQTYGTNDLLLTWRMAAASQSIILP